MPAAPFSPRRQRLWPLFLCFCLLLPLSSPTAAEELEYRVKAAYLYKFASYVQWPPDDAQAPFVVGIIDAGNLHEELSELFAQRGFAGRRVQVKRLRDSDDLDGLHILFIGRRVAQRLETWSDTGAHRPFLLISEAPGALRAGSMINFVEVDRRIRFEVNQVAAERAGLKLSARLLSAALHVQKE